MGKFFGYFFSVLLVTGTLIAALGYFYGFDFTKSLNIQSPIPDFLMLSKNNQVQLLDFWSPVVQQIHGDTGDLADLTAQSVLMYDLSENKILYEREPEMKRPMASLTKIITAIIALENRKPDDKYIVSQDDIVGQDSM